MVREGMLVRSTIDELVATIWQRKEYSVLGPLLVKCVWEVFFDHFIENSQHCIRSLIVLSQVSAVPIRYG